MKCIACNFENRTGVLFCEECGHMFEIKACPKCGFNNRPEVNFCEECGHDFAGADVIEVQACPECGFGNRPEVNFCEECGHAFAQPISTPPRSIMPSKPVTAKPIIQKPQPRLAKKRHRWIWAGAGLVSVAALAALVVFLMPIPPATVEEFAPAVEEIENASIEMADDYAQEYGDWVDVDSREVQMIESEAGKAYMITYESDPGTGEGLFSPRLIVVIDPITGELGFIEAP